MDLTVLSIAKAIPGQTKHISMRLGTNIISFKVNSSIPMLKINLQNYPFCKINNEQSTHPEGFSSHPQ